jgi:HK97 family phage prohead protease
MSTTPIQAPEGRVFAGLQLREVEATESYSMIRGLAVPYGKFTSIGWFMESFAAGSLGKSIREAARDLPLNLFHDGRSFPIGAADSWDEADSGLTGTWRIDRSETAQNAARLADDGLLTGLSIEFMPIRSEWEILPYDEWDPSIGPDGMDKVTRLEARLCAVGLVQSPAYVKAGVDLVRSADARQNREGAAPVTPVLEAMKRRTEALRNR